MGGRGRVAIVERLCLRSGTCSAETFTQQTDMPHLSLYCALHTGVMNNLWYYSRLQFVIKVIKVEPSRILTKAQLCAYGAATFIATPTLCCAVPK